VVAAYEIDSARTRAIHVPTKGAPLAITADDHDDWTYEVILDAAAALVIGAVPSQVRAELQSLDQPVCPASRPHAPIAWDGQ
jgi:hypothetical protein